MSENKALERFGMFNCDGDCKHCDSPLNCSVYTGTDVLLGKKVDVIVAKQLKGVGYEYKQYTGNVEYINYDITDIDNAKLTLQLALVTETKEADFVYLTMSEVNGTKAVIVVREDDFNYPIPVFSELYRIFDSFYDKEIFRLFNSLEHWKKSTADIDIFDSSVGFKEQCDTHSNLNEYYRFNKENNKMEDKSMTDFNKETNANENGGAGFGGNAAGFGADGSPRFGMGGAGFGGTTNIHGDCTYSGCGPDSYEDDETYSSEVVGIAFVLGVIVTLGTIGFAKVIKYMHKR